MTRTLLALALASSLYAGPCSSIDVGSSLYGHKSWHGFVPGTPTSTYRQNITSATVDPNSTVYLGNGGMQASNTFMQSPVDGSGSPDALWPGFNVHYVHDGTQRRMVMRDDPTVSKIANTGSMTNGSAILTTGIWASVQGRQTPYFSQYDVGLPVSVSGACTGTGGYCLSSVLGGNYGAVLIASVQSPTQATLTTTATATITGTATVTVDFRQQYPTNADPGTVPIPTAPKIEQFSTGPHGRPFGAGVFLDRFQDPNTGAQDAEGDQHIFTIGVDDCIEYSGFDCFDDGSNISCAAYAATSLLAGDIQRPYGITGGSTVAAMPEIIGMLRPDEFASGSIPHALNITSMPGQDVAAYTGSASHSQCCGAWPGGGGPQIPFGAKLRLKPQGTGSGHFDASGLPASCAPLVAQMRTYGLIYIDGGYSGAIIQATGDWAPFDCVSYMFFTLDGSFITATNFDVVLQSNTGIVCPGGQGGTIACSSTPPSGSAPTLSSFSASPSSVNAGDPVTFAWTQTGAVDVNGNDNRLRWVVWGQDPTVACTTVATCKMGQVVDGPLHGEKAIFKAPACPGTSPCTWSITGMVQNRFGRTWTGTGGGNAANATVTVH